MFVYSEDRDQETGHGWRDVPHVIRLGRGPDGDMHAIVLDEEGELPRFQHHHYAGCSYAWITTRKSFDETGFEAADELRTCDVKDVLPGFAGCDDMEGHFEFAMNPERMRGHLEMLGMKSADDVRKEKECL
jgi:hypothetical protein